MNVLGCSVLLLGVLTPVLGVVCSRYCHCQVTDKLEVYCVRKNFASTHLDIPKNTQILDISFNVISVLRANEFQDSGLKSLTSLLLHHNHISLIDSLSFNGLNKLEYLDISSNHLRRLEPATFHTNRNLRTVNVSYNNLGVYKMGSFLQAPSIQHLNIKHCSLAFIPVTFFQGLEELQDLIISDNNIIRLNADMFKHMTKLRNIDLSLNSMICNSEAVQFIAWLRKKGISSTPFCEDELTLRPSIQQPMLEQMISAKSKLEPPRPFEEMADIDGLWPAEETTAVPTLQTGVSNISLTHSSFIQAFQVVPSFYAGLCGLQLGMVLGALIMYSCLYIGVKKKAPPLPVRSYSLRPVSRDSSIIQRASRLFERGEVDLELEDLVPGTPPSPYRSVSTLNNGP